MGLLKIWKDRSRRNDEGCRLLSSSKSTLPGISCVPQPYRSFSSLYAERVNSPARRTALRTGPRGELKYAFHDDDDDGLECFRSMLPPSLSYALKARPSRGR